MIIRINSKTEKIALLKALQSGLLDTNEVQSLKEVLEEKRPDMLIKEMTDEELDQRISELESKLNK